MQDCFIIIAVYTLFNAVILDLKKTDSGVFIYI